MAEISPPAPGVSLLVSLPCVVSVNVPKNFMTSIIWEEDFCPNSPLSPLVGFCAEATAGPVAVRLRSALTE